MKKTTAIILALCMMFTLAACSKKEPVAKERDCGVYVTMEATDVYAMSYGCEDSSGSVSGAKEGEPLDAGEVYHFDFAGAAAESTEKALIDYTICLYDKDLEIIADASFTDDFSNMAEIHITVTSDHRILNENSHGCGADIIVSYGEAVQENEAKYQTPFVEIMSRPEAADAINAKLDELNAQFIGSDYEKNLNTYSMNIADIEEGEEVPAFSMSRTVRVLRADSSVLSIRIADKAKLGTVTVTTVTGISFDPQTGSVLGVADITNDLEAFSNRCAEEILVTTTDSEDYVAGTITFTEGYTDTIKTLIADGHWYFAPDGIVFVAEPGEIAALEKGAFEFTVPFSELKNNLKTEYLPCGYEGDNGDIVVSFTEDISLDGLTCVGAAEGNISAVVKGNIYEVSVYTVKYNAETNAVSLKNQLFHCSDICEGGVISVDAELEESPALMISFIRPDGNPERRLIAKNSDGRISVTDPDGGETGSMITEKLPFSVDLDSNGRTDTIELYENNNKEVTLNVTCGDMVFTQPTTVCSDVNVRLFDADSDGIREIFVDGKNADGKPVTYAFSYDQALKLIRFGNSDQGNGMIKEFSGNSIILTRQVSILGKYAITEGFTLSNGVYSRSENTVSFDNKDSFVTSSKDMTLKDGSILAAGTKLRFTVTDGVSFINFVTDQGITGTIEIKKLDGNWTIAGAPDTDYFESLPY